MPIRTLATMVSSILLVQRSWQPGKAPCLYTAKGPWLLLLFHVMPACIQHASPATNHTFSAPPSKSTSVEVSSAHISAAKQCRRGQQDSSIAVRCHIPHKSRPKLPKVAPQEPANGTAAPSPHADDHRA
eukprot:GHRQ01032953.1.p3 GENE.GHRQ01032953.1~~GHRQ01032953.1.p3  ORF type:complete len:129 (+),score=0.17 GHRQ01032953.1:774-1160(+)